MPLVPACPLPQGHPCFQDLRASGVTPRLWLPDPGRFPPSTVWGGACGGCACWGCLGAAAVGLEERPEGSPVSRSQGCAGLAAPLLGGGAGQGGGEEGLWLEPHCLR